MVSQDESVLKLYMADSVKTGFSSSKYFIPYIFYISEISLKQVCLVNVSLTSEAYATWIMTVGLLEQFLSWKNRPKVFFMIQKLLRFDHFLSAFKRDDSNILKLL